MSIRWRLARLISPVPIMADPFPGDGCFVVMRRGTIAAFRAETLDVAMSTNLTPLEYGDLSNDPTFAPPKRSSGTFSGTIA